jgi:hypothetical protein
LQHARHQRTHHIARFLGFWWEQHSKAHTLHAVTVDKDGPHSFELGARVEELLHPDFSQWPRRPKRGEAERNTRAYRPIPLQSLGSTKVPLEHAFKSLMNQICDAGAGEYVFLRYATHVCIWQ